MENYFWRLLRCERLLQSLSGNQIFTHVTVISEGGNIRTTPRGSPRSSRNLDAYYAAAQPRNPVPPTQTSSSVTPTADVPPASASEHSEHDDGAPTPTPSSPYTQVGRMEDRTKEKRRSNLGRPPPILKNTSSSGSSKSASSKSPIVGASQINAEPDEPDPSQTVEKSSITQSQQPTVSTGSPPTPRYISTRFSEQVAVSIPQAPKGTVGGKGERSSRSFGESSLKSSKRGHVVHAGSVASRKRPIVMRHRSSQASSPGKPSPTSPYFGPQQRREDEEGLTMASPTERRRRAVSPHPGIGKARFSLEAASDEEEDEEEAASSEPGAEETTEENTKENTSTAQSPSPLVEPDFRSKFADRSRPQQHRSFTNLSSAAWRSTAVAPTAASYQASGLMFPEQTPSSGRRGSGRAVFKDEIVPLKAPAPAGPGAQDDTEDVTSLPRTKSQLTLLLERSKAAGQDAKGKGPAKH